MSKVLTTTARTTWANRFRTLWQAWTTALLTSGWCLLLGIRDAAISGALIRSSLLSVTVMTLLAWGLYESAGELVLQLLAAAALLVVWGVAWGGIVILSSLVGLFSGQAPFAFFERGMASAGDMIRAGQFGIAIGILGLFVVVVLYAFLSLNAMRILGRRGVCRISPPTLAPPAPGRGAAALRDPAAGGPPRFGWWLVIPFVSAVVLILVMAYYTVRWSVDAAPESGGSASEAEFSRSALWREMTLLGVIFLVLVLIPFINLLMPVLLATTARQLRRHGSTLPFVSPAMDCNVQASDQSA